MGWSRFWRRRQRDAEIAEELESYLAHEAGERIASGDNPDAARHAAMRKLGNATRVREDVYAINHAGAGRRAGQGRALRCALTSPKPRLRARLHPLARARHRRQHRGVPAARRLAPAQPSDPASSRAC
jgi:hypothetical protein